jgi:hypothetical protein
MHRVGVRAFVAENNAQAVAFLGAQAGARHAAVVGPGRKEEAGRDLDLLVLGNHLEGTQSTSVGKLRDDAGFPVSEHCGRIEAVARRVDLAHREHPAVRVVPTVGDRKAAGAMPCVRTLSRRVAAAGDGR